MTDRNRLARRRGLTLMETVFAGTLALIFTGVYAGQLVHQQRELAAAQAIARAASALQEARERLRAGALAVPPPGEEVAAPADGDARIRVTARRAAAPLDPRAADLGLALVVLRAEWCDRDGRPLTRELVTLADVGGR